MMKKIIAIILSTLMLFSFCSCGSIVETVKETANKNVERGVVTDNVYTSEFNGLTFTADDSWTFSTREELAELMEVSVEELDEDEFSKTVADIANVYDMMAESEHGDNVLIAYENLLITSSTNTDEEQYSKEMKKVMEEDDGSDTIYTHVEDTTVTLSGKEFLRSEYSCDVNGVTISQYYYFCKIESMMCNVIVTPSYFTLEEIEAMFS